MFFAITPVRSCPIYLICQYPVWIITGSFLEPFHGLCQTGALVIRFERYFFDPSVHIFLLLIQCSDRQIQTCFFFCCCISVTHELFQIPYVPCNITKLFSQGFPYFLCTVFFASGKCQIIFSGAFFVTSRQRQIIGLTKTADDRHPYGQADLLQQHLHALKTTNL